jgi:hypothetical protein
VTQPESRPAEPRSAGTDRDESPPTVCPVGSHQLPVHAELSACASAQNVAPERWSRHMIGLARERRYEDLLLHRPQDRQTLEDSRGSVGVVD